MRANDDGAYLVVLIAASVVLPHSQDKVEDRDKRADGVGVPSQHDITEADVVVRRDMACSDTGERRLGLGQQGRRFEKKKAYIVITFWLSSTFSMTFRAKVKSPRRLCTRSRPMTLK